MARMLFGRGVASSSRSSAMKLRMNGAPGCRVIMGLFWSWVRCEGKALRITSVNYTIYSPNYRSHRDSQGCLQDGHGECWDYPDIRSAKRKAKELGMGSLIVRNFNQADRPGRLGAWWQSSFCWVWNGVVFKRSYSVVDDKWVVVTDNVWSQNPLLTRARFNKS
jgi:hypothetical protein